MRKKKLAENSDYDTMKQYIVDYVEKTFPPVYRNGADPNASSSASSYAADGVESGQSIPWHKRLYNEIVTHHKGIRLFSANNHIKHKSKFRYLLLFELLSTQTMLMFVMALCFDLEVSGVCILPYNALIGYAPFCVV